LTLCLLHDHDNNWLERFEMKKRLALLAPLLTLMVASTASGQAWTGSGASYSSETTPPVSIFLRFSPQARTNATLPDWQYGIALSPTQLRERDFVGQQRGMEVRLGQGQFGLWSQGSNGKLLANFSARPQTMNAQETSNSGRGKVSNALLIGGVIVGAIVIAAAISPDKEPLLCSGNTVPNPIAGTCEPVR
jgi:hypothetical protein